jgi:hypothetical protein
LGPEPNLCSSTYYRNKSAQLNSAHGGHLCPSNHVGTVSPDCGSLSIRFAEDHELLATMSKTLPRPSGRGTKRTSKFNRALAHQIEGLKPQDCFPIPIHELKLVAITPETLPKAFVGQHIAAGNRHNEALLRAGTGASPTGSRLGVPTTSPCRLILSKTIS